MCSLRPHQKRHIPDLTNAPRPHARAGLLLHAAHKPCCACSADKACVRALAHAVRLYWIPCRPAACPKPLRGTENMPLYMHLLFHGPTLPPSAAPFSSLTWWPQLGGDSCRSHAQHSKPWCFSCASTPPCSEAQNLCLCSFSQSSTAGGSPAIADFQQPPLESVAHDQGCYQWLIWGGWDPQYCRQGDTCVMKVRG